MRVKWRRRLVVTVDVRKGLRKLPGRWQCATWHSFQYALACRHRPLSQLLEALPRDFRYPWAALHGSAPSSVSTIKLPLKIVPATKDAMQSALDVQSVYVDMSRSTIAGHLPHSAQALCRTETITSASQLKSPAGPVFLFIKDWATQT
jgi:hypothetical protein